MSDSFCYDVWGYIQKWFLSLINDILRHRNLITLAIHLKYNHLLSEGAEMFSKRLHFFFPASSSFLLVMWLLAKVHAVCGGSDLILALSVREAPFDKRADMVSHYSIITFSWFVLCYWFLPHVTYIVQTPSITITLRTSRWWHHHADLKPDFVPNLLRSVTNKTR